VPRREQHGEDGDGGEKLHLAQIREHHLRADKGQNSCQAHPEVVKLAHRAGQGEVERSKVPKIQQ
jgi:hypothetical protein